MVSRNLLLLAHLVGLFMTLRSVPRTGIGDKDKMTRLANANGLNRMPRSTVVFTSASCLRRVGGRFSFGGSLWGTVATLRIVAQDQSPSLSQEILH